MSTKRFITLCALLLPIICVGQNIDIKLDCQMSLSKTNRDGVTKETFNENIEVQQYGEFLGISFSSGKLSSLHTKKTKEIISVTNLSNKDKWSIYRILENNGLKLTTTVSIDRNTGLISVTETGEFGVYNQRIESQGSCKKIDTTKRLF
jgi:hypothetical protein